MTELKYLEKEFQIWLKEEKKMERKNISELLNIEPGTQDTNINRGKKNITNLYKL